MAKQNSFLGGDYFLWLKEGVGGNPPGSPPADVWDPAEYTETLGCITTFDFQASKSVTELGTRCGDLETFFAAEVALNIETLNFNRRADLNEGLIRNLQADMGWAINSPDPNPETADPAFRSQINDVLWWLAWDNVANHVRYAGVGTVNDFNVDFPQDNLSTVSLTMNNRATTHPVWRRDEEFVAP